MVDLGGHTPFIDREGRVDEHGVAGTGHQQAVAVGVLAAIGAGQHGDRPQLERIGPFEFNHGGRG